MLVLVALSFMYYYARRKQIDAKKERDEVAAVTNSLKEVKEEIDALAQLQKNMGVQIRNVANHSRSVEQWLGQARESWAETIHQLRSEFEAIEFVDDQEEEEQEEQDQDQGEGNESTAPLSAPPSSSAPPPAQPEATRTIEVVPGQAVDVSQ